jgi:peptidyl-prolyl cis-trans isomerase SurA
MRSFKSLFKLFAVTVLLSSAISAQETQVRVVDEVVAQVNEGVITLSRVKREIKEIVETYVQEGKPRAEAERLVEEKQGELIANLINEELLLQKGKELNVDPDVEASINQRFVEIMKQYNMKTVDALNEEMLRTGVDPKELRDNWRRQITRERVLQREVQSKLFWEPNAKSVRDYFEANKAKFKKPETVSFSELYIGFAGRNEAAVSAKIEGIHAQLLAGGDFAKFQKDEGDPGVVTSGTGKAEDLIVGDIVDVIGLPLKGLKAGQYTKPIRIEDLGMVILRVDSRSDASNESFFDENSVRMAMMQEKAPDEQRKFMAKLREGSYIKISDTYRPVVAPVLFSEERKEKPGK